MTDSPADPPAITDPTALAAIAAAAARAATADELRGILAPAYATATAQKVRATAVAQDWSALAAAALRAAHRVTGSIDVTWHVSGSVGRGEALPGADLETLLVRGENVTQQEALAHAAAVHDLLDSCGFRRDGKGATADRSRFCRTADEWAAAAAGWSAAPARDRGVVMAGLLTDCAPPATRVPATPQLLAAMRQDATALREHVPSRFKTLATRDDTVDVKAAVLDPVVKIARWAALGAGSAATATTTRLATPGTLLDKDDAAALTAAYLTAVKLRWMLRASGRPDTVALSALSPQDRAALRGAGRTVAGVARTLDYLASTSAFSQW